MSGGCSDRSDRFGGTFYLGGGQRSDRERAVRPPGARCLGRPSSYLVRRNRRRFVRVIGWVVPVGVIGKTFFGGARIQGMTATAGCLGSKQFLTLGLRQRRRPG